MKRSDLQHYLMKELILRLDYNGLLESDLDVVVELRNEFLSNGFRLNEGVRTDVNFKIADAQRIEDQLPTKEITKSKQYVFQKDNISITVEKNALILSANTQAGYTSADIYITYFMKIVNLFKEKFGDIISYKRLGFRKINSVILKDIGMLSRYFNEALFNTSNVIENIVQESCNVISSNEKLCFEFSDSKLNLITESLLGEMKDEKGTNAGAAYRITFDIDAYKDQNICKNIEEDLLMLNNKIFEIYMRVITSEFTNKLSMEEFEDNCIGGVVKIVR